MKNKVKIHQAMYDSLFVRWRFLPHCAFVVLSLWSGMGPLQATSTESHHPAPSLDMPQKPGYASVFKKVSPAVVSLYALRVEKERSPFAIFGFHHGQLDHFDVPTRKRISQSLGSGSIVRSDGLIITNSHVVHGAHEVKAVLQDRREYSVDIILEEPEYDLAVLKIKAPAGETFPFLTLEDSDLAETGDIVLAIGNPLGLSHTLTQGVISAVGRTHVGTNIGQSYIQADAVINPGNSGGPLITLDGKILGVCTLKGPQGIGFAIPANTVRPLLRAAIEGGQVVRPWMGLDVQSITPAIAESLGLKRPGGVIVTDVQEGSPAKHAGLEAGDAILAFNNSPLSDDEAFTARVGSALIGTIVDLDVLRKNGVKHTIAVQLKGPPEVTEKDLHKITAKESPLDGLTLAETTPAIAAALKLTSKISGVVVYEVVEGSPADHLGFLVGDVIDQMNGEPLKTVAQLKRLSQGKRSSWQFIIKRGDQTIAVSFSG